MLRKYPPLPNLATLDLRLIRVFLAVVRNRGFSAAQAELNINQPTISLQMSQLEGRLGVVLCKRGRGGFKLTPEGEFVYEAAQKLFEDIEKFRSDIARLRGEITGEIHIGIVDAVATNEDFRFHQSIRHFNSVAGSVDIRMHVRSPQELLRSLLEERIHLAIAPFTTVPPSVKLIKLHKELQVLYCARTHEFFDMKDEELTAELLATVPYVARNYLQDRSPPHFMTRASTGDMEAMVMYILSGRFIGYLPKHYAERWIETNELRPLLEEDFSYESQFFLASLREEKRGAVLAFVEHFLEQQTGSRNDVESAAMTGSTRAST